MPLLRSAMISPVALSKGWFEQRLSIAGVLCGFWVATCPCQASAQDAPQEKRISSPKPQSSLDKDPAAVVVDGTRGTDTEERRYSTAAKMVFGREELDRYGDSSVGEVIKRLPGVTVSGTPGRGGDIRMRGLGKGYTLIMINGEPVPRGFSLDSLPPEQVERIEVMRAPVAEHSARAIAGTINVVLREDFVKRGNEVRTTLGWEDGHFQPGLSAQRSDTAGNLNYNVTANLVHRNLPSQSVTTTSAFNLVTGVPTLQQTQQETSRSVSDGLNLNARLNWRLGPGDSISLQPFLMQSRSTSAGEIGINQPLGVAPYARETWRTDADNSMIRAMGNVRLRLDDGAKMDIRFNGGLSSNNSRTARADFDGAGTQIHLSLNTTGIRDTTISTAAKYSRPLKQEHLFATGLELEHGSRTESASTVQDGVNALARFGDNILAQTNRLAAYAQDEWEISPVWAVYGGVRWEGIQTQSETAISKTKNMSSVLSPLFHSVWRLTPESKDQVRLGLTRTYRSPTLANLVAVPTLSSAYPVSGSNTATSPDTVGNPDLKPELAWGFDLAIEHYFDAGGLLSASVFRRNIENLIRNVSVLQTVSWSALQRWVSTPQNLGRATSHGLELEGKFRLDEVVPSAWPMNIRANYSRFWSSVDDVPGPNNRLDQQPKQTANLGIDYRFHSMPLTLGGNLNWTPAFVVQQTDAQSYYQGTKRVLDLFALWKFDAATQLRLSGSNWTHADYETGNRELFGTTDQTAGVVKKTYPSVAARLEMKF